MKPIDALDEAVRNMALSEDGLNREGIVTGWVLMVVGSRLEDDGDPTYWWNYSVGPTTDLVRSLGTMELVRRDMYNDIIGGSLAPDDGDD